MPDIASANAEEKVLVQVRLPKDLVKTIDHLGVDHDLYRAQVVERLLRLGLSADRPRGGHFAM